MGLLELHRRHYLKSGVQTPGSAEGLVESAVQLRAAIRMDDAAPAPPGHRRATVESSAETAKLDCIRSLIE